MFSNNPNTRRLRLEAERLGASLDTLLVMDYYALQDNYDPLQLPVAELHLSEVLELCSPECWQMYYDVFKPVFQRYKKAATLN